MTTVDIESRYPAMTQDNAAGCETIDVSITVKASMSNAARCDALDMRAERMANPEGAKVEKQIVCCEPATLLGNVLSRRYYAKASKSV